MFFHIFVEQKASILLSAFSYFNVSERWPNTQTAKMQGNIQVPSSRIHSIILFLCSTDIAIKKKICPVNTGTHCDFLPRDVTKSTVLPGQVVRPSVCNVEVCVVT